MRSVKSLGLALVFAVGCAGSESPPADDAASQDKASVDVATVRQAIEATNARFIADFKAGNAAALSTHYTPDAIVMAPSAPAMRGTEAITTGIGDFFKQLNVPDFTLTTEDVVVAGDLAIETGAWTMSVQPKAGGPAAPDKGKYIVIWKQQPDGSWKLHRDIWNSDNPPPSGH
jgi:uncharacterized protein (TIGR02246 family)